MKDLTDGLIGENVRVASIKDDHGAATEETAAGGSHLDVGAVEVVDGHLGQHRVVCDQSAH